MPTLDAEGRRRRAKTAGLKARHPNRPELWADDLRAMRYAAAEQYVQQLISDFPSPTPEQRARLAELLLPAPDAGQATDTRRAA